ncbi:MAG: hypothetical protein ACJAYF_002195 [Arenicella sp.]|jgi:hypothetical protein
MRLIIWGYISEFLLASFVLALLINFYGLVYLANFLRPIATDIATYFSSVMFTASIAFLWAFYSKSDTPFSKWLYQNGAFTVYLTAYIVAMSIYAVLFLLLLIASTSNNVIFLVFTLWVLLLGVINAYSFIRNVIGQLLLNMEFNRKNEE